MPLQTSQRWPKAPTFWQSQVQHGEASNRHEAPPKPPGIGPRHRPRSRRLSLLNATCGLLERPPAPRRENQQLRHPESRVVIRSSVMSSVEPNRQGACTPPVLQAPRNRTGGERVCSTTSDHAVMGWRVQRGAANPHCSTTSDRGHGSARPKRSRQPADKTDRDLLSKEPKAVFQPHNCPRAPSRRSGEAMERQVGNQKCRGCSPPS